MMIFEKINITQIINDHIETLVNDNKKRPGLDDCITFLLLPIFISTLLLFLKVYLDVNVINIIITALAILLGLLFNVIIILFDIIKRDSTKKIKNNILEQLISNISFAILLSIFAIIMVLCTFINNCFIRLVIHWYIYFILSLFLLTVLMILKRIYTLFKNEIKEIENN
ncbi:MAG: hypothetical protein P4L45_01545 [Ignavibacteriaceae bacterium]|nr:hypothetical protein [Ignavibacteriaceae bacterium]